MVGGGAYGQSGSVFVLDGVATVNAEDEETLDFNSPSSDWNRIPKDVKMYMMNFMTLEDYARMRQVSFTFFLLFFFIFRFFCSKVSKEWRRAGMKHHYAALAKEREEAFERQKRDRLRLRREESARRRRECRKVAGMRFLKFSFFRCCY